MATEDLTTYIEIDTPGRLTVTADKVDIDHYDQNEDVYLYKDYGANYFNEDWDLIFDFQTDSLGATNNSHHA